MSTVLITGGGTGGHLMPALAIARALETREPGIRVFFVGAERGLEAHILPHRHYPYVLLPTEPIYRQRWWMNVRLPLTLFRSMRGAARVVRQERPSVVVGTGGYVSGPVVWAATRAGVPAVLQEQNAFPGVATRRLARRADQIHLGFPEASRALPGHAPGAPGSGPVLHDSGNPILPPPDPRPDAAGPRGRFGLPAGGQVALVFGGSQGSLALNQAVAGMLEQGRLPDHLGLIWQTGPTTYEHFSRHAVPGRIAVVPFIDPMADAYAASDLVVSRSGAMSLAEIMAWGLPPILVPLPTAAANHQLVNARATADAGAGVLLEQRDLSATSLAEAIVSLAADPARMADMASAARARARPRAADTIAKAVLQLVSKS